MQVTRDQKWASDSLVEYLQATVSHLIWNLGTEPKFSVKHKCSWLPSHFSCPSNFQMGFQ